METWPGPGFGILVPLKSCGLPTSSLLSPMWTRWATHCQLPPQGGQGPGPRLFERLLRLAGQGGGYQIGQHGTTNGQVLIFKFFSSQSPILIDQDVLIFGHWSIFPTNINGVSENQSTVPLEQYQYLKPCTITLPQR